MAFFSQSVDGSFALLTADQTLSNVAAQEGFSSTNQALQSFLNSELGSGGNVTTATYTGADSGAYVVDRLYIQGLIDASDGLLLTSGGIPGPINTVENFSVNNGALGDSDLDATAQAAFSGAGTTNDAAIFEFTINVTDTDVDGVSFDLFFGSDEFPEFSDTTFVDIAALYVNGVNYAFFDQDPSLPLSIIDRNLNQGNFVDNTSGNFPIEWDGFIELLTVRAPLNVGTNTVKIGVADTGDFIYDSGIFINNINLLVDGGIAGGILTVVNGSDASETIQANDIAEELNLFSGQDTVSGTPDQLNGDVVTGFGTDDTLEVTGVDFDTNDITVTLGSAILDIDTNNDGNSDTTITLAGNFEGATFSTANTNTGTEVTVDLPVILPDVSTILDAGNSNVNIDGAVNRYTDFGGQDTFTILSSISRDVEIIDNNPTTILLPSGLDITEARFIDGGVQFDVNGSTVTLIGNPALFTYVFGGTPLDPSAGTQLTLAETASAFGTAVPGPGAPPATSTISGSINADGTVGNGTGVTDLSGLSSVSATDGEAEIFVLEFDSSSGSALSSDAVVEINGFNPAEDILRFDDANATAQAASTFLNGAGGAVVVSNSFSGETLIAFQDDNTADNVPSASVTLLGITDATLGGSEPFFEIV